MINNNIFILNLKKKFLKNNFNFTFPLFLFFFSILLIFCDFIFLYFIKNVYINFLAIFNYHKIFYNFFFTNTFCKLKILNFFVFIDFLNNLNYFTWNLGLYLFSFTLLISIFLIIFSLFILYTKNNWKSFLNFLQLDLYNIYIYLILKYSLINKYLNLKKNTKIYKYNKKKLHFFLSFYFYFFNIFLFLPLNLLKYIFFKINIINLKKNLTNFFLLYLLICLIIFSYNFYLSYLFFNEIGYYEYPTADHYYYLKPFFAVDFKWFKFFKIYFLDNSKTIFTYNPVLDSQEIFYDEWLFEQEVFKIFDLKTEWNLILFLNLNYEFNFLNNYLFNSIETSIFNLGFNLNIKVDFLAIFFLFLTYLIFICCFLLIKFNLFNLRLFISLNYYYYFIILNLLIFCFLFLFVVQDLIWFFIFFELSVIPLYFLLGIFGTSKNKYNASTYLLFYTLFGSTFLIFCIIFLWNIFYTTNINILKMFELDFLSESWVFFCLFFAFAIKVPLFPFHIWLPKAHVESPTIGSVILAALILKLSGFGFIRFLIPLTLNFLIYYKILILLFILIGILYCSFINLNQIDFKVIIAYSSIIHMGFSLLGLFSGDYSGFLGSVILMLSHGLTSAALFICVGFLYDLYRQRIIFYYSGLTKFMPFFSFFFFLSILSNISFPGTFNFLGEFFVLLSLFKINFFIGFISLIITFINLIYSLTLFTRLCFGDIKIPYKNLKNKIKFFDFNINEILILFILLFFTFYLGIQPYIFLKIFNNIFFIF